jgi:crossover junction endodeoxyribonuclease RusA
MTVERRRLVMFSVPLAQPKERHRKGAGGRMYTPEKTVAAEEAIGFAFKGAARGHRPDDTTRWGLQIAVSGANAAADVDNLAKVVMDGLQGVLYVNDKQVDELHVRRLPGREKRTEVTVYRIEEGS